MDPACWISRAIRPCPIILGFFGNQFGVQVIYRCVRDFYPVGVAFWQALLYLAPSADHLHYLQAPCLSGRCGSLCSVWRHRVLHFVQETLLMAAASVQASEAALQAQFYRTRCCYCRCRCRRWMSDATISNAPLGYGASPTWAYPPAEMRGAAMPARPPCPESSSDPVCNVFILKPWQDA